MTSTYYAQDVVILCKISNETLLMLFSRIVDFIDTSSPITTVSVESFFHNLIFIKCHHVSNSTYQIAFRHLYPYVLLKNIECFEIADMFNKVLFS